MPPEILPASHWLTLGYTEEESSHMEAFQIGVLLRDERISCGIMYLGPDERDWRGPLTFHDDLLPLLKYYAMQRKDHVMDTLSLRRLKVCY